MEKIEKQLFMNSSLLTSVYSNLTYYAFTISSPPWLSVLDNNAEICFFCSVPSRISSSSSTEPLTASHGSLGRSSGAGNSRHRPNFFSQLSGQTFYNNEYGHLSEEGFCDFFSSPDAPCLASSNV